jgi:hypothetical protein
MKDMKLIMEGWRHFSENQEENTIFLFESHLPRKVNFNLIVEEQNLDEVLGLWESSSNYEYEQLLTEIEALDKAKEFVSDVGKKVNNFILKLSIQAFMLLQKGAKAVKRVVSIIAKIMKGISKYCQKLPTICKIAKTTAAVLALFAIAALFFSTDAQAAIQMGKEPLDDSTYNYLRGFLMDMVQDNSVDMSKKGNVIDIVNQLDALQANPDITQYSDLAPKLKTALETAAEFHNYIGDLVDKGDITPEQANDMVEYFTKLGETSSAALETITSEGPFGSSQSTSLRFRAGDLPPHPFRESVDKKVI